MIKPVNGKKETGKKKQSWIGKKETGENVTFKKHAQIANYYDDFIAYSSHGL